MTAPTTTGTVHAAPDLDTRAVTTLRMLAADAVEAAGSGHPGLPMGAAGMAYVVWTRFLRHDADHPDWPDRDRFVLSAGHGSMLLYALLHLSGYDLQLDDLRAFRQWGSRTPGHPEAGHTPGVETTTGPLGQGLANAVGMALAERMLAARFNRSRCEVVSHRTFVLASDGDLMEGVTHEAASLAGHLGLGKLVVLYDDNRITIDGPTSLSFSENVPARFASCGWDVSVVHDGNELDAVERAITAALADERRPSLIAVRTIIGDGAPTKAGSPAVHGAPLGPDELAAAKRQAGWPLDPPFFVPDDVRAHFLECARRGKAARDEWTARCAGWARGHPDLAAEWLRTMARQLPDGWEGALDLAAPTKAEATRVSSGRALVALAERVPEVVGGSADLASSTNTAIPGGDVVAGDYTGRTIHFGVREHAMGALVNGIALHGGLRPFCSTFLVFSDYMRPAIRLAALSRLGVVYVFTHDSIGLGEDGPTHQPVEQLGSLRMIPGLAVLRPADAAETYEAWRLALLRSSPRTLGPTALVLSRQALPQLEPDTPTRRGWLSMHGARVLTRGASLPEVAIVATGSEVSLALAAAELLRQEDGLRARVVSMPWRERFEALSPLEQEVLLPRGVPRLVVEAASARGWETVAGPGGGVLGLDRFGASAPGATVLANLGFTAERVAAAARRLLENRG